MLARQLGTQYLRFSFFHLRGPATELRLGCARAERSAGRWLELLGIRFEQLALPAPVIAIRLQSGMTQALPTESACFGFHKADVAQPRSHSIAQLAERLAARIGDQSVHSMTLVAEHRPQYAWRRQSILSDLAGGALSGIGRYLRRPLWMLPEPVLLPADGACPLYQGHRIRLLEGPERLETGWWDDEGISRDYYTAVNSAGMQLWVFRDRRRSSPWYLHGYFG
jgi:protein ImuB